MSTRRPANCMTHRAHRPERGNTMKTIENTTSTATADERNTTTAQDGKTRRDRVAVRNGIAAALFDGMTDGVSEVQLAPLALLLFVALDHARLVADAAGDDLGGRVGEPAVLKEGKQRLAAQHTGLDGLRRAVGKDGGG